MKLTRVRMGLVVLAVVAASLVGGHATPPGEAYAHANLARSAPASNSTLDSPPNQVVVWFTEPVEPKFSEIQVLDIAGARVDRDDSIVDRNDPTAVSVTLEPLPDGTYTVAWTNVSTVDGHRVRGSFVFSVGEPISGAPVDVPNQPLVQSPWEPVFRWTILLTSLSIVGGLAFELMVWRPVLSGSDVRPALVGQRSRMGSRSLKLILVAVGLCLVGSVGQLVIQTQAVHDISLAEALGGSMGATLSDTEWGRLWLWRVGLLAAVGVALVPVLLFSWGSGEDKVDRLRRYLLAAALAIGGGMLFVHSMGSHGAATAGIETPALFSDYLHLLAAAFWVGGLVHFALGAPLLIGGLDPDDRGAFLSALAPRFSTLAILSVGVLVVTGIYSGWAQVTVLAATNTPYGLTLVSKLALIVPLLALGAVNLLWIRPRLAVDDSARRWLKRLVAGEVVLAVVVLAAVAMLASLEPARQVASREGVGQENKLTFRDTAEGADIVLEVEPGRVGPNRVLVSLEDRLGVPIDNASDVSVRLTYLDADLGETRATAGSLGGGDYAVEEVLLSIAGPWQVEVVVRRPDAFDARTAFRFEAGPGGGASSSAISPSPDTGKLLWGVELALLGALFLGVGIPLGGWYTRWGKAAMWPGIAAACAGLALMATTQFGQPGDEGTLRNPFPPNPESLEAGLQTYETNCQICHGAAGRGNGPGAGGLDPPPADLVVHVPLHPEGDLFRFIHDGIPGTAMTALGEQLTDEEIWHVINYIKTLE